MYRCLTEFPDRSPGCVVPVSTLTYELNGGRLWGAVGGWERVTDVVVALARADRWDAMPLGIAVGIGGAAGQRPAHHAHNASLGRDEHRIPRRRPPGAPARTGRACPRLRGAGAVLAQERQVAVLGLAVPPRTPLSAI